MRPNRSRVFMFTFSSEVKNSSCYALLHESSDNAVSGQVASEGMRKKTPPKMGGVSITN